jgi:hypothetical protein
MKIMTRHGSASPRKEESQLNATSSKEKSRPNATSGKQESRLNATLGKRESPNPVTSGTAIPVIDANLKRRARKLILDSRIPGPTRGMLRYGLEIKDPYLPQLVRRVESGEMIIDYLEKIETPFGKRPAP